MPNKKSHKLLIAISVLIVFLLIVIGFAVLYFTTDFLKSNKQLFSNYISQIGKEQQGFINEELKKYLDTKESTPYKNTSKISFDINDSTENKKYENVNKMNITLSGEVNNTKKTETQNISINYSDKTKFPFIYKRQENQKGIQTEYIGSKFVAANIDSENNNLTQEIPELQTVQDAVNMLITKEDLQYLNDMYLSTFNIQAQEDEYSKIQEADNNSYRLTLKGQNLKDVIKSLLDKLKNDTIMLDKLNLYIKTQQDAKEITMEDIENIIQEIEKDTTYNEKKLEITVNQKKGIVNKLTIASEILEINIEKISEQNQLQYNIDVQLNVDDKPLKAELKIQFSGLQSGKQVTENYNLKIQRDGTTYNYTYNNAVEFVEGLKYENLDENNSIVLDTMEEESRKNLVTAIRDRIKTVNAEQMQELGLEENENLFQYIIPQLEIFNTKQQEEKLNEVDVNEFNKKFENYASTNLQGVTVKGLLTTISINNGLENEDETQADEQNDKTQDEAFLIKEIHFDGAEYEVNRQNIASIKISIETESYYRVEFEKNSDTGIIYRVVINKK